MDGISSESFVNLATTLVNRYRNQVCLHKASNILSPYVYNLELWTVSIKSGSISKTWDKYVSWS